MSSSIISKHGSSCSASSSSRSSWTTPRLRDSSTAKTHVSSCVYSSSSSQIPVHASSTSSSKSTSSLHAVLITRTPTKSSTRTLTSSASATSTSTGGCSSSSAFFSARPCSSDNSRWTINRKSCCTQLGYATPSSSSSSSTAGCHTNHQFLMPLMLTLTYADPHLFSMFMAMVAVAATATATIVAVAKSESSTPTSSCQQSRDTSSTKSRISVEDRVSLEKVASSSIPLVKTTATVITATRPKTTTPLPPARTSWAQNNNTITTATMTRCIQNHTVVSDHHQHCHEHAANDNDNATVTDIFEDHPHDILIQGIPEYFRFADPTGVYGILDEIDILTQRMENYPINLILAPGTLEKIRSRIMYSTQCNDQANSEPNSHRVQELITRSPGPILAF